jgi:hypothetical protein
MELMDDLGWMGEHLNSEWTINEGYVEYFKNNVMIGQDNNGPYDGWFRIPNWREAVSLRKELRDPNSLLSENLVGDRDKMLDSLKIVTLEEYIEEFHPDYIAT